MDTGIVSGPGRQLAAIVPPLADAGYDVRPICFQRRGGPKTPYMEFLAERGIPFDVVTYSGRTDPRLLGEVREVLGRLNPAIVQTHSYRPTVLAALLRARGATWRWIGFFHGLTREDLKVRVYHFIDRVLLHAADEIVVMAATQRARFRRHRHVRQVYNAVLPAARAAPGAALEQQLACVDRLARPRVGVLGRLSWEKGVDVLLESVELLERRGRSCSVVVAGDGPERARLEEQAGANGQASRVAFLGTVLPVEPLYERLDVLVIPSRSEGLPNVLLEALRADVPVVSTRVGAVPDLLEGSRAGVLVPVGSPAEMADGIEAMLKTGRSPESCAARSELAERFSLGARVAAHVRLYEEVLAR
jgi:glycosyltransferase involved in cell wall biosynthesis